MGFTILKFHCVVQRFTFLVQITAKIILSFLVIQSCFKYDFYDLAGDRGGVLNRKRDPGFQCGSACLLFHH